MIEVSNLVKYYGRHQALKDVSFKVQKGEILGLLGPNGAGKSTIIRILACFFPPTSGTVKVDGFDVTRHPMEVRKRLGYLPENVPLYRDITVAAFLEFTARIKGLEAGGVATHLDEVMELCGISHVATRHIRKLSKGYCQRVGVAQALIGNPKVLILDEPTVGLDPKQITEIRKIIKEQSGKRTVLLSTHILPEANSICDTAMIINRGRIVARDTPEALARRIRTAPQVRLRVQGAGREIISEIAALGYVVESVRTLSAPDDVAEYIVNIPPDNEAQAELARFVANRWRLMEMRIFDVTLEEVFMNLITEEEVAA